MTKSEIKTKKVLQNLVMIGILISIVSCDQISKNMVRHKIEYNTRIDVVSKYVVLTKVENTGAFLGLGNNIPRPVYILFMIILPLIVIGYAIYYLMKENKLSFIFIIGLSFVISGGLGNIIDRILHGSVTDFLYFNFMLFHTGIVNLADISVTAGVCIILFGFIFKPKEFYFKPFGNN